MVGGSCAEVLSIALNHKMNFKIQHYESVSSTNILAKKALEDGAIEGTVISASHQAAGYGQRGHEWDSPVGNLYMSLILTPQQHGKTVSQFPQLAFVPAVAISQALQTYGVRNIALKWPNDILIDQKKVAGILVEIVPGKGVVIGLGINILCPPHFSNTPATYLSQFLTPPPISEDLRTCILAHIEIAYSLWCTDGFHPIQELWMEHAYQLHEWVKRDGKEGIFIGIDEYGSMLLQNGEHIFRVV